VLVREVDDGLGGLGASPDAGEIVEVTALDASPLRLQCRGGRVRPGQPGDLMSGGEKLIDGSRTDPSGGSGNENVHDPVSLSAPSPAERLMSDVSD
jgi:hypothetical protein